MEENEKTYTPLESPGESLLTAKEALTELIELLQMYSPPWYTEERHNRAISALRRADEGH
jgi:hypothetical protein